MIMKLPRNSNILSLVFILSLGLNVVFISYGITTMFKPRHQTVENAAEQRMEAVLKILPASSRDAVREAMEKDLPKVEDNLRELRHTRRKIMALLSADIVDSALVKAGFAHLRELNGNTQQLYQDTLADAATQLPPQDRQKMVDSLKKARAVE